MTRRFDGAITTPEDVPDSTRPPTATRPARPLSIEISAAILIVGGLMATLGTIAAAGASVGGADDPGTRVVIALLLVLNVVTMVVGVLVRRGTAWILCVNVVAIVLFVELTAVPSGGAYVAVLAALDAFVFVALLRNRAWFDWRPPTEEPAR